MKQELKLTYFYNSMIFTFISAEKLRKATFSSVLTHGLPHHNFQLQTKESVSDSLTEIITLIDFHVMSTSTCRLSK